MNTFIWALEACPWASALEALKLELAHKDKQREAVLQAYARLFRALTDHGAPDLLTAVAQTLLWQDSAVSRAALHGDALPAGLKAAALQDLEALLTDINRDWQAEAARATGRTLPPLKQLGSETAHEVVRELRDALPHSDANWLLAFLLEAYRKHGVGVLAQYEAFRWQGGALVGIAHPVQPDLGQLVALESQLTQLTRNTLAFLNHKPAYHTLLYGPRGSGKSTAIRGLIRKFGAAGLRLIELAPKDVQDLPAIVEVLRARPHRYILFVDDLSFEAGDTSYQPLKTLLEGSLTERPDNVLVYATSNRRHLVKEHFSDRPDPLNDDVHAWDTHNERLALADRFGLTITFPNATQQRYLELVEGLLKHQGMTVLDYHERAIQFAERGNGYSGRTAQQFVDGLKAELS
jgi:predicted AAA+ superfamily ATPase